MMSVSHRYRNFGETKPVAEATSESASEALEDQKLEAFEAGYQAGWDDAAKARAGEKEKLSAELAQNLQDMSFSYHEALSKLTLSLEPSLRLMIEKLLPEMVRTAIAAHVLEQVQDLLRDQIAGPLEIVVRPQNIQTVKGLLQNRVKEPFEIVGDDTLGEGQAFVRVGHKERQIDLDSLVAEVSKAMTAFFHDATQESVNGQ